MIRRYFEKLIMQILEDRLGSMLKSALMPLNKNNTYLLVVPSDISEDMVAGAMTSFKEAGLKVFLVAADSVNLIEFK